MATKINDVSSALLTNAFSGIREAKTTKAESAFQSFLDNAVTMDTSQNMEKTVWNQKTEPDKAAYTEDRNKQDIKTTVDDKKVETDKNADEKVSSKKDSAEKTEAEKADEVIDEVCKELGVSREELMEQFDELMESIAAILMDKFGVTQEQLYMALETLGLTMTDMFNQTDLINVAMVLTGTEDIAAVLTDEQLYAQIQEAVQELSELKNDMTDALPGGVLDVNKLQTLEKSMDVVMTAKEEIPAVDTDKQMTTDGSEQMMPEAEPALEVVSDKKQSSSTGNEPTEHQMTGNEAFQQFTGRVADYAQQIVNGNEFVQQTDMQEVVREIMDYVRLQVNAETTSLEMQLHPESYGKLNLHVSVREGVVTAKLAVENEMVKSALEAQVVQLKEDMNERGLHVDAVEVTIESHEFERNLEEGQNNNEETSEERHASQRQINLMDEEMSIEELDAMSEAEALTRKIMLENGNSINFSA